eukprot:c26876_g1_i1 orf=402-1874(-)
MESNPCVPPSPPGLRPPNACPIDQHHLQKQQEAGVGAVANVSPVGQVGIVGEAPGTAASSASVSVDGQWSGVGRVLPSAGVQSQPELVFLADGTYRVGTPAMQQGCEGSCALEPLPHASTPVPSSGDVIQATMSCGPGTMHLSHGQMLNLKQESTPITAQPGAVNGCTPDVAQEVAQGCTQKSRQERESTNEPNRRRGRFRHRKNPRFWKQQGSGRDLLHQGLSDAMVEKGTLTEKAEPRGGGPGWCFLCHVDCVTAKMLKQHLAGKKHKKKLAAQNLEQAGTQQTDSYSEAEQQADAPDEMLQDVSTVGVVQQVITESTEVKQGEDLSSVIAAVMSLAEYKKKRKRELDHKVEPKKHVNHSTVVNGTDTSLPGETIQKKSKLLEKCELCNIYCTSRSLLESHIAGKKHAARIQQLEKRKALLKSNDENTMEGSVLASFGIDGFKQTGNEDACMIAVDVQPVTAEIAGEIATDTMKETCKKSEDACGTIV